MSTIVVLISSLFRFVYDRLDFSYLNPLSILGSIVGLYALSNLLFYATLRTLFGGGIEWDMSKYK